MAALGWLALLAALALALPAGARADAPATPIATNYVARVDRVPPGLDAKVIDGYLSMWLTVPADRTVYVIDYLGAPYIRFDRAGVSINRNSQMYYLSQTPIPATPPAGLTRTTPPHWLKVSSGHTYMWRDGRLHALTTVALPPGTDYLGRWHIPLSIDGRRVEMSGGVFHNGPPSPVWFWPILVVLACVAAAWRLERPRLDARIAKGLALAMVAGMALSGAAHELHGRPHITPGHVVLLALILAVLGAVAARVLRGRSGYLLLLAIAFGALWAGLGLISTVLHGYVLLAVPAFVARADAVGLIAGGAGLIPLGLRALDRSRPGRGVAATVAATALLLAGCGAAVRPASQPDASLPASLLAGMRTIGRGPRFDPPARGPVDRPCRSTLGRRIAAHVELFGANHVILIAAGVGTRGPRSRQAGRITRAACYGAVVTLDPTGTVLSAVGAHATVAELFRSWGEPLSDTRIASFTAAPGHRVAVFVDGRRRRIAPGAVPLTEHAEIVLEVGPYVPPHRRYAFPPLP